MDKKTNEQADTWADESDAEDESPYWVDYPHQKRRAVPVTQATAGVDVISVDMSELDDPPMFLLKEYYPPEDDVEGDDISVHGTAEALELATTLLGLVSQYHDLPPLYEDPLDDEDWSGRCIEPGDGADSDE